MEQIYLETEKKSISREEDLKQKLSSLKEQVQEMKQTLRRKDEEIKAKDDNVRGQRLDETDKRSKTEKIVISKKIII